MIRSTKEVWTTRESDDDFWTYLICLAVDSGRKGRYYLVRIDSLMEKFERLGYELPLKQCRDIIKAKDPSARKERTQ